MHDWFSARTYAETVAWSKIIVDQATDRILGAHFVEHASQELVNVFGLTMRVWHHRHSNQGLRLRLPDVFLRHQAHALTL
jgi:pyruvate/2-oxoglutarate dehydrogenase complex dihydrolipoamide dehydrogenase (E3) component